MRWAVLVVAIAACSSKPKDEPPPVQQANRSPFETFDTSSPRVGEAAAAFTLDDVDGKHVTLAEACAKGPVVLVWGSFS